MRINVVWLTMLPKVAHDTIIYIYVLMCIILAYQNNIVL